MSSFDHVGFRADVVAYMDRWHLSARSVADEDISLGSLLRFLRGEGSLSLDGASALCQCCDLSLDKYVVVST